jgi:uncharacterized protein (DUF983 family)
MSTMDETAPAAPEQRDLKAALKKGALLKCPNCGQGPLLHSYLKVHDSCSHCSQPFHHQRADDGPAYFTILIVGHLLGFAMHIVWSAFRPDPITLAVSFSIGAVLASLLLLPRIKGMLIALQWAKRMHGF